MTFSSPDSVASGKPYMVVDVAGAAPMSLDQFMGESEFSIERSGTPSRIKGVGMALDDSIRFFEKDLDNSGKDVRVWLVRQDADGRFTAETLSLH